MKSNIITATLKVLKFPLKLLARLVGKKRKVKNELEERQRTHVWNFDPTRLKNRTWQKSIGKYKKNKAKFAKRKQNQPRS